MWLPETTVAKAKRALEEFERAGLKLATAESCTGGLISAGLTSLPGSSAVVERGFVTYSNEAKAEMLGVPAELIQAHGAVSSEVACAMAEGALAHSRADVAVAVTGVAGPGGGTPTKPVGLVYLATARRGRDTRPERHLFPGGRSAVRLASAERALELLVTRVSG